MGKTTTIITRVSGAAEAKAKLDDANYLKEWGFQSSRCAKCGISNSELNGLLLQCARCRQAHYCGLDCLKADYENHNQYCGTIDVESVPSATDSESGLDMIADSNDEPKTVSKKDKVKSASKGSQSPKPKKKKKKTKQPMNNANSGVDHSSSGPVAPCGEQGGADNSPQPLSKSTKGLEKVDQQTPRHQAEPPSGAIEDQKERDQSSHDPHMVQAPETDDEVEDGIGETNGLPTPTIVANEVESCACSDDEDTAEKSSVGRLDQGRMNLTSPQSSKTRVGVDVGRLPTHTIEQFNSHPSPNPGHTKHRRGFKDTPMESNAECGTSKDVPSMPDLHAFLSDNPADGNEPNCPRGHFSSCDSPRVDDEDSDPLTPRTRRQVGKLPLSSIDRFQSDKSPASGIVHPLSKRSPTPGKATWKQPRGSVTNEGDGLTTMKCGPKESFANEIAADEDQVGRGDGGDAAEYEGQLDRSTTPGSTEIQGEGSDTAISSRSGGDLKNISHPLQSRRGVGRLPNEKFGPFDDTSSTPRGFWNGRHVDEKPLPRDMKTSGQKPRSNGIDHVDFPCESVCEDQRCSMQGALNGAHDIDHDQYDDKEIGEHNGVGKLDKSTTYSTNPANAGRSPGKLSLDSVNCFDKNSQQFRGKKMNNLADERIKHQRTPYSMDRESLDHDRDDSQNTGEEVAQLAGEERETESLPYQDCSLDEIDASSGHRVGKIQLGELNPDPTTEPTSRSVGKLPLSNITRFNNEGASRSSTSSKPGRLSFGSKEMGGIVASSPSSPGKLPQIAMECFESPSRKHETRLLSADSLPDEAINCFENPNRTPTRRPLRSPGKLKSFAIRAFSPKTPNHAAPPPAFSSPVRRKWTPRRQQPAPGSGTTSPEL